MRRAWYRNAALVACLLVATIDAALHGRAATEPAVAMERFLSRPIVLHQYRASRHLEASGSGQRAWLDAQTEFSHAGGMQYTVVAEGGSRYIRSHVLRALLEQERQLIAQGRASSASLDRTNYAFTPGVYGEDGLVRIELRPLRKDRALIAGSLWLRPEDGELMRVEGQLARSPSIWMKKVDVVRRYARINDVLVPIVLESTAHLRLFGRSSLRMTYDYSEVADRAAGSAQADPAPEIGR